LSLSCIILFPYFEYIFNRYFEFLFPLSELMFDILRMSIILHRILRNKYLFYCNCPKINLHDVWHRATLIYRWATLKINLSPAHLYIRVLLSFWNKRWFFVNLYLFLKISFILYIKIQNSLTFITGGNFQRKSSICEVARKILT